MTARLPDVVIIGAPKAGTTTLTAWLRDHPQIAFSDRKELEFFDLNFERGTAWYLEQLPQDPADRVVVEATPTYLSDPQAPDRIASTLPDTRFVALLREPLSRAWSQYWFFVQLGVERRSWEQVVAEERPHEGEGFLWRGLYGAQLTRWEALVGADRLHVELFDDLIADADSTLARICAFMGVAPTPAPSLGSVNPTRLPRSSSLQRALRSDHAGALRRRLFVWNARGKPVPKLTADDRARWAPYFREDLDVLAERLGRPLPAGWRADVCVR